MNKTKLSNPVRLIAFFLTTFLLVSTFGLSVDGWQTGEKQDEDNNIIRPNSPSGDNGDNKNDSVTNDTSNEPEFFIPQYINRLTGLETDENGAKESHYAFIINGDSPFYGISGADLLCELPTENGTRYVAFISDVKNLWKCGDIEPSRGYISNIARYFGGICVSYGNDDSISYNKCDMNGISIDLSLGNKYHYTEFGSNVYCNYDLLKSAASNNTITPEAVSPSLPFNFLDFGEEPIIYEGQNVKHIRIEKSNPSSSDIYYNEETSKYTIGNGGSSITDPLNGKVPEFTNCFILFADSVTYDNLNGSQMIMNTIGSGMGYYFSMGGICEIKWSASEDGYMSFTIKDGTMLAVNRGSSYISFQKSSMIDKVSFQ